MSSYIDLDSNFRDREVYPNENSYRLTDKNTASWFEEARTVRPLPKNPTLRPLEFVATINITYLTLPYSNELSTLPRVYIDFHSMRYNDIHLISTIGGVKPYEKFICIPDRVQEDNNGTPLWIHYKCMMEQTMRFNRKDGIVFSISSRNGSVLPQQDTSVPDDPDPLKQTLCTFQITPYLIDADYTNHLSSSLAI